jgi:hypothetical protein
MMLFCQFRVFARLIGAFGEICEMKNEKGKM